MPTYIFYDTVTKEEYEEFMSISELDEYKKTGKAKGKTTAPTDVTLKSEEEYLREQRRLLQQQQ